MEINKKYTNEVLSSFEEIIIPFYQRDYVWEFNDIEKLIDDVRRTKNNEYFLGTIIFKNKYFKKIIVDGQQRLTSLLLIFKSIYENRHLSEENKSKIKLIFKSLKFSYFKDSNKSIIEKIVCDQYWDISEHEQKNSLIWKNYKETKEYFKEYENDINNIFKKIYNKTVFSVVVVDDNVDEHILFSQINSTGKKLTSFDLIKNDIFSKLCEEFDKDKNIENEIDNKLEYFNKTTEKINNDKEKDNVIRYFIAHNTTNLIKKNNYQSMYREYLNISDIYKDRDSKLGYHNLFEDFCKFCTIYSYIKFGDWKKEKFYNELNFIIDSFNTYANILIYIFWVNIEINGPNILHKNDDAIKECLFILEIYKVRRFFCLHSEKTITRFIPKLVEKIRKFNYIEASLEEKILIYLYFEPNSIVNNKLATYAMPTDEEFNPNFFECKIYNHSNKNTKNFLIRLSTFNNKTNIDFTNFSVEHILPQNYDEWKEKKLIIDDNEEIQKYMHTICNLTITNYNSDYSNKVFEDKKNKMREKECLNINKWIVNQTAWNVSTMKEWGKYLFNITNQLYNISSLIKSTELKWLKIKDKLNEKESKKQINNLNIDIIKKRNNELKKITNLSYENIQKMINDYYNEKLSFVELEKSILGFNFNGNVVEAIFKYLDIPFEKSNIDLNNILINSNEKINEILSIYKEIINDIE